MSHAWSAIAKGMYVCMRSYATVQAEQLASWHQYAAAAYVDICSLGLLAPEIWAITQAHTC